MGTSANDKGRDASLWRQFADSVRRQESAVGVDASLLAAYLDGSATPDEVEMVERAMASDPARVEVVKELRELQKAEPVEVPEPVIARLKMTVSAAAGDGGPVVGSVAEPRRPRRFAWWQRVAAAAAVIAMSFVGYQLGRDASQTRSGTDADLASAMTVERQQEETEYDLLAMLDVHNGNTGGQR